MKPSTVSLAQNKVKSNKEGIIACLPLVFLAAKIIVLKVLPAKYFYDSINILSMSLSSSNFYNRDKSYQFAANVFSNINFMGLNTINEWHIVLGLIFTLVFIVLILGSGEPDTAESIYILAAFGLLQIYVFTISKELCQLCIYCLILILFKLLHRDSRLLLVLCTGAIFAAEGVFFRTYYYLVAVMFIGLAILFRQFNTRRVESPAQQLLFTSFLLLGVVLMIMVTSFFFAKTYYLQLATVRFSTNGIRLDSADAKTVINNLIKPESVTTNPLVLFINYLVNTTRMLFPLELLTKGAMYVPFCIFQLATTYFIARAIINAISTGNTELVFFLTVYLAYFSISVMFEPDYGSWVRHDVSTFPILVHLILPNTIRCKSPADLLNEQSNQLEVS